jgi:hypothetical protein
MAIETSGVGTRIAFPVNLPASSGSAFATALAAPANDVLATTQNDDVRALANAIVAAQTAEIAEMSGLLGP